MIEDLKNNIELEIEMAGELSDFVDQMEFASVRDRKMVFDVITTLKKRIKLLNNSIPEILKDISLAQKLDTEKVIKESNITKLLIPKESEKGKEKNIALEIKYRNEFLEQLNINEILIRKLKKKKSLAKEKGPIFKKINLYGKISNRFFLSTTEKFIRKGEFKSLSLDLRRSNLNILTSTYISMMFFSTFIALILGLILTVVLIFFEFNFSVPFFTIFNGNYLRRSLEVFWIGLAIPLLIGTAFYFYPGAERKSLSKRIEKELPFIVIHMGSISGSGIEPLKIFQIVGLSEEYKYTGKEIKKILNQTNVYGYDLTTALRDVARMTPSTKLSELLNGMSVTINSGGDIKTFFEKRAESLLLDYRLERERFTKTAETFMDIYISVVIATPMILLLLLIMISVTGIQVGVGIQGLAFAVIGLVVIANILFMVFLHLKQPTY